MMASNGQPSVPPGFRFHPTDEELLYYYLRKKVSYEAIDLDVIREIDLNKLEPWDLKDKCKIGTGPQNEWYFFSHKDKKYPTGTRTNRATAAGFWKATGRDKAIHLSNSKRIGMRKTLVFYIGRAPHGQKTDWIMHEYRLEEESAPDLQEDGWVVCRVFKKKNHRVGFQAEMGQERQDHHQESHDHISQCMKSGGGGGFCMTSQMEPKQHRHHQHHHHLQLQSLLCNNYNMECSMHLPQLLSPEVASSSFGDVQEMLRLTAASTCTSSSGGGDWSFLDKLLAATSHQQQQQQQQCLPLQQADPCQSLPKAYPSSQVQVVADAGASSHHKFPFHYLGCDPDMFKFPK